MIIILIFLITFSFNGAISSEKKSMIVKRSEYGDQKVSESGYTFQSNEYGPIEYSRYGLDNGNAHNIPFGYVGPYQKLGKPKLSEIGLPSYYNRGSTVDEFDHHHVPNYYQGLQLGFMTPTKYSLPLYNNALFNYGLHGGNYSHIKQDGGIFDGVNSLVESTKAEKGYKNKEDYDNAAEGKHFLDENQEQYSQKGDNEENKQVNNKHNSQAVEMAVGARGGSFGEFGGNRKGSKTTGYHKVYHRDEYKKDHSFYDEKDTSGHHNKYDSNDSKYEKESGKFENGKHSNSGHKESNYSSKDFHDQGKYYDENNGRRKEQANLSHFDNNEKYAQEKEKLYQDENGYAVSDSQ